MSYSSKDLSAISKTQHEALEWFYKSGFNDFVFLKDSGYSLDPFPYKKMNLFLQNMISSLKDEGDTFESLCLTWKVSLDWEKSIIDLFRRSGCKSASSEPLWVFVKYYLKFPPIEEIED